MSQFSPVLCSAVLNKHKTSSMSCGGIWKQEIFLPFFIDNFICDCKFDYLICDCIFDYIICDCIFDYIICDCIFD